MSNILFVVFAITFSCCKSQENNIEEIHNSQLELPTESKFNCLFQNEVNQLGIGIAVWNYDCEAGIVIFEDSLLKNVMYDGNAGGDDKKICPFLYKPDYGIFHLVALDKSADIIKVLVNNDNTAFVSSTANFKFVPWDNFLVENTTGIRLINGSEFYTINSVQNEYLEVLDERNRTSLIRWREGEKLLIELLLLM